MATATLSKKGNTLTVRLECEIDHHTAKDIRERIDRSLDSERPGELILDFSKVSFMDSLGIGLIIGRVERASSIGAAVTVTGASGMIRKLLSMSGIEKLKSLRIV